MRLLSPLSSNKSRATLVSVLCWFTLFTIFQFIDPFLTISRCSFPRIANDLQYDSEVSISKVLVIADPQLIDNHTYPGRLSPLLSLSKFTVDNYIYKNYVALMNELKPQTILFLGDLLDNGRESTDEYYENEYQRFIKVFVDPARNREVEFITSVPGNHDIGWADGVTEHSLERFGQHFGHPNKIIQKGNHDLILLDNLSLMNTVDEEVAKPAQNFLNALKDTKKERTRILFDHVTLWRDPEVQVCGASRESKKPFPISKGYQYQTAIDEEVSLEILRTVRPDAIFSGDDHDYCQVVHSYRDNKGKEHKSLGVNVKSMSMAMGIKSPAVELLTLYNKPVKLEKDWIINNQVVKTKGEFLDYTFDTCYLTKPYVDIVAYVFLAIVDAIWLFTNCVERKKRYVSIADNHSYDNFLESQFKNVNWLAFIKLSVINGLLAMFLYYLFTLH